MVKALKSGYREVRRVIRHGPAYPWRRYISPARVLETTAIHTDERGDVTVCVLTSRQDWLACLWSLVSFCVLSDLRLPVLIYSDGTLESAHKERIRRVFPDARIVDPVVADRLVPDKLSEFPNCKRFRLAQPCARRIIDLPILCTTPSILMLDSDVLFFRRPEEIIMHLSSTRSGQFVFERDMQDSYFDSRDGIRERFGVEVPGRINCGIMLADISNFDYACIEQWLGQVSIENHPWAEQTLWAMYAGAKRTTFLGKEYDITNSHRIESDSVMKHYVKPIRVFMYTQGIPRLLQGLEARV